MRRRFFHPGGPATVVVLLVVMSVSASLAEPLPWENAGLTERQAAAHLLDRFAFGPRPGDVERLLAVGLEDWLEDQIDGPAVDVELERELENLDSWSMEASEIARTFLPRGLLVWFAHQAGAISREALGNVDNPDTPERRREVEKLFAFMKQEGYRPQSELMADLLTQKLLRALVSERQLEAVLLDFWFNHFNVSTTDSQARGYLMSYERDAILPEVLGSFPDMLMATAQHPAMLLYLDNANSAAEQRSLTTADLRLSRGRASMAQSLGGKPPEGLNENYARELLELHTLGVDGGYTQDDVVEVARAFTGWTVVQRGSDSARAEARLERLRSEGERVGFHSSGDFLFRADAHDAGQKVILGRRLPSGGGLDEGLLVLDMLALHPSTARHICRKLAMRFVGDDPSERLVERLSATFLVFEGDIARVMRALAWSDEFWSADARRAKIKSPFEVAVTALRALDAEVDVAVPVTQWVARMGQPLYGYQAPTGFPDRADHWVSTGGLLSRMNFGIHLAAERIPGVSFDLEALNSHQEPESLSDALSTYAGLLMPERDLTRTVAVLEPIVADPGFTERLEAADARSAGGAPAARSMNVGLGLPNMSFGMSGADAVAYDSPRAREDRRRWREAMQRVSQEPPSEIARVVGVILGSPEFQRR